MSLSKNPKSDAEPKPEQEPEPKPEQEPEQELDSKEEEEQEPDSDSKKKSEVDCDNCYRVFSPKEKDKICALVEDWANDEDPLDYTVEQKIHMLLEKNHCFECSSFECSDCGERKANCEEGSKPLYEGVCIDCSRCPHCGCAMCDYECGVCLRAGRAGR